MRLGLNLLAAAGLAASAAAAHAAPVAVPGCSKSAVAAAGAAVRTARTELAAVPLEADETQVPPPASQAIEKVKDRLRAFVRAEMACAPASPDVAALADAMAARSGFFTVVAPGQPAPEPPDRHGGSLDYAVHRVDGHPAMLAVVATLGIKCGSDSMLMLYERAKGGGWRELMVRRAGPYSEVKGGWGDLRFAVSPKDAQGRWFVATVSTTPWCTSAWQGLPFELARPGPAPDRPNVFFRGKGTIYLGDEEDLVVRAERDAFELRHTGASLDPAVHSRRHVRRYAVSGDSVRRVQPVAENVRDFVDEWIVSPWPEARDWSGRDPELARVHARLHPDHYGPLDEFASIRACAGGLTQVEIGADEGPGWFFLVRGGDDGPWTMEQVARRAAAGCAGPDRLGRGAE